MSSYGKRKPYNDLSFNSHQHEFYPEHYSRHGTYEEDISIDSDITEDDCDEELQSPEFIIDDGFIKFLEISMEHKLKRKKQLQVEKLRKKEKESEGSNLIGVKHGKRKIFKTNLYGQQANKIMAMENAMEISFNQQKDMNKPVLWPNIPLNL